MHWLGKPTATPSWARAAVLALGASFAASCYSTGDGTAPPPNVFYFPVGLAVSNGGNVLYAVNSDFDLQWNGGTLQSYDLHLIRKHAAFAIEDPNDPALPLNQPNVPPGSCPGNPPIYATDGSGTRQPLGATCAPNTNSTVYVRDSAIIGAFATDLQRERDPVVASSNSVSRLFAPVRGDATLTWADIVRDDPTLAPSPSDTTATYPPFALNCGPRNNNRCDASHHAGNNPNEDGNTRQITMPGEPFGMAQSEDGTSLTITHQSDTKVSLFTTGFDNLGNLTNTNTQGDVTPDEHPSLQFVLGGFPSGGVGLTAIPHDILAFCPAGVMPGSSCVGEPRPAFLETFRAAGELDVIRYYSDDGETNVNPSSLLRPYIVREGAFTLSVNSGGTDSRGIVIDTTPRIACEAPLLQLPGAKTDPVILAKLQACARLPARLFFANRTPATMIVGEVGGQSVNDPSTYDPDHIAVFGNVPLSVGVSKLYLAPIVDGAGNYALRVFIVCFDSATIYVYDPDAGAVEAIIRTGSGPFALAFDPFDMADVAVHAHVPADPRDPGLTNGAGTPIDLKAYRFAYIASFTNSYVQVLDLDNSRSRKDTFETVVYTLGYPTLPKGSQ